MLLFALTLYHTDPAGRTVLHAMPVMIGVLLVLALAYRYYSAFLAAKVAALDDSRVTPAHRLNDGQNYHPTNKWVAFGHHFAAISGAGPLIGPVLAIQYGYMPGLLWLVIGVCLAGAVQDMLVLAASVRRDGKSLAEIARHELGRPAAVIASVAILFIVVIALAGLGFVVVKALGGEEVKLPAGMQIFVPVDKAAEFRAESSITIGKSPADWTITIPGGSQVRYSPGDSETLRSEPFVVRAPHSDQLEIKHLTGDALPPRRITLPAGCTQVVPGSSWGTFTIACTIPIALFTGLWMYRIRKGRVIEASLIGGSLTLFAVVAGGWIPGSAIEHVFSLTKDQTILSLVIYGFIAAVLPVWLLLGPRDYLSSFLKIGTVILLVGSVIVANPPLRAPMLNEVFVDGGPTFRGSIFPFVFICVMCGAISGFHALVASGTTPKMVEKESHVRTIGYGAMLIEGLVGVVALIAAASLPNDLYYDINIAIDRAPGFSKQVAEIQEKYGQDRMNAVGVDNLSHLNLGSVEQKVGGESLRGRTGGAVTLAVGMSVIFEDAFRWLGIAGESVLKYWYHFAIMFEALFILTTIDAGTRIGRFLLQETLGRIEPRFARPDWLPGSILASAVITGSWGWLIWFGSIETIWPMFGIANQLLAALALALVTTWIINSGRGRYAPLTIIPLLWVCTTTLTAAKIMLLVNFPADIDRGRAMLQASDVEANAAGSRIVFASYLNISLTLFVVCSVGVLLLWSWAKWMSVALRGRRG
ncbi:carbon starvation CstA family protein [Limnoglobus roseus]|uniref:Carbon starvation protein A n=1 Tax=Limnoglobus roseus TaxID=2598579 RepID=A0A5C1AAE9_9BACT|nr:carbon starvation protein A [Limnoglobus roseus]QEL16191.1 carbon starvation protein A [Limnoglobus roseus]